MAPGQPNLSGFLLNLSRDPQALANFQADPQAVGRAAGLANNHLQALAAKDPAAIQKAIIAERQQGGIAAAGDTEIVIVVVI